MSAGTWRLAPGDVIAVKRRLGFLPPSEEKLGMVVQVADLNLLLDTTYVVPLMRWEPAYQALPYLVHVPGEQAGTGAGRDLAAVCTHLGALPQADVARLVGRAAAATLAEVRQVLKRFLGTR